jgi:hypothetical protein
MGCRVVEGMVGRIPMESAFFGFNIYFNIGIQLSWLHKQRR